MSEESDQSSGGQQVNRHQRVKEIFAKVLGLPESERTAMLDTECGEDASLRAEIESLLAHATEASTMVVLQPPTSPRTDPLIGSTIGHYHIKSVIGAGGMGTVYEAQQESPRRTVALKVIRAGVASASLLRRFEHEAQDFQRTSPGAKGFGNHDVEIGLLEALHALGVRHQPPPTIRMSSTASPSAR